MPTPIFFKLFPYFKPKSLKGKFIASVLPPVTISFLIISLIAGILTYHNMKTDILDRYEKNSQSYIDPLRFSLWNMNNTVLESELTSILNNPDITGVKVVEAMYGKTFTAGDIPDNRQLSGYLVFSTDIAYAPYTNIEVLGTLSLYYKKKQLLHAVLKQFFQYSLLFLILVVIVIASSLVSYHRTISIPLEKLLKSIRRFDSQKNVISVEWAADDEMGEVISSYNGLIVSLEMGNSQLRDALDEAKRANQIKSEFLANMSHEIRTPLNGIQGMAELALETRLNPEQQNFLKTIYMESDHLLTIINDILDFSKIEAGKMEIETIPFDLRHTIENLCASLSVQADKKGIELVHYLKSSVCADLIGDPGKIRQILINLIGNSIKFTQKGDVFLHVQMIKESDQTALFHFEVTDTGIGIPKEKQKTIFESFSQADGSTTRRFGGTGLGITISKMLVEKMGGSIGVKSQLGQGTMFHFDIEFLKQTGSLQKTTRLHADFSDLTIMVVDDLKISRKTLVDHLESWGCHTMSYGSGQKALDLLQSSRKERQTIDAILLDYHLQDMSGFDLAKAIRRIEIFKDTPLAILTSTGIIGDGKQSREIGVNGYLTKPICQEDLKLFVSFVLDSSATGKNQNHFLITRHTLADIRRKNIKILLVEDYQTNQQLATRQLENAGFHVTLAGDGQEAVHYYSQQDFDIILMDIQMPKMDGYQACNKIRKLEGGHKRTPIIAMTAHAMEGYKQQCLDAGMDDYITKPLKKEILLSTVGKWIQHTLKKESLPALSMQTDKNSYSEKNNLPMEIEKALAEFDDDEEFFLEVFDNFLLNVEKQITLIDKAINVNDFETIKAESHSIKGGAANLRAVPLSNAAYKIELLGRENEVDTDKKALHKIISEWKELKTFRNKLKKSL